MAGSPPGTLSSRQPLHETLDSPASHTIKLLTDQTQDVSRAKSGHLICFSHLRWNFVWQRPQHLLTRAARRYNVWVIEEPIHDAGGEPYLALTQREGGICIAVPHIPAGLQASEQIGMQRRLIDMLLTGLAGQTRIFWYYTPAALRFSDHIDRDLTIYDNMDELSAFDGASKDLLTLEHRLLGRADLVFTGGLSLYEAKLGRHNNLHAFPSSIDAEHFGSARRLRQETPPTSRRPRLGFFGVVDERMDTALLDSVAALRPDWDFVVVGPVVKIDQATLPNRANLHWAGACDYKNLPRTLAGWDIGIMPFALNEATRFISPTKTPEFLAAGLPVVSTPITDVVRTYGRAGLVEIAETPEAFVAAAAELLERPRDAWLRAVDAQLALSSWDSTWNQMHALAKQALKGHGRPAERIPPLRYRAADALATAAAS